MNVLSGAYAPTARGLPAELVVGLTRSHGVRGDVFCHTGPGLVMAHRPLQITPEDARQQQPFLSQARHVIVWDGRLDNRDELRRMLRLPTGDAPDVELVAQAFDAWGLQCLDRLVGDWSVVIFDSLTAAVHLASDYMGNRPLYYAETATAFIWSSRLDTLLKYVDCFDDLDTEYLVGYLAGTGAAVRTPYRPIRAVMAGHVVTVASNGRVTETRAIQLRPPRVRHSQPEEYAEQLRTLFTEAVAVRLRASGPVWMDLSGGWDSSAIVCMAAHLLKIRNVATPGLHTFSLIPSLAPHTSELRFIRSVEVQTAIPASHVTNGDNREQVCWSKPDRVAPARFTMAAQMATTGACVLLNGGLGDGIMANYPDASEASLEDLHWRTLPQFLRQVLAWSIANRDTMWHALVWCLHVRLRGARAVPATGASRRRGLGVSANRHLIHARQLALVRHLTHEVTARDLVVDYDPQMSRLVEAVCRLSNERHFQSPEMLPTLRMSFPYTHRPLVETVLGFPLRALTEPHRPRALMRRALGDLLPPEIVRRFSKGYAMPELLRLVKQQVPVLKGSPLRLVELGIVDPAVLSARVAQLEDGALGDAGDLFHIARLETWLRERHTLRMAAA